MTDDQPVVPDLVTVYKAHLAEMETLAAYANQLTDLAADTEILRNTMAALNDLLERMALRQAHMEAQLTEILRRLR